MEASDTFGAGVESPADDPFASAEEEFAQEDPLGPEGGEPPVVNREGERVEPTQVAPTGEDEAALAEADRMREEGEAAMAGDSDPTAAEEEQAVQEELAVERAIPPGGAAEDVRATDLPPTDAASAPSEERGAEAGSDPTQAASGAESPASSATPASEQENPSSPAARDASAPAESPGDGGPSSATATPPSEDDAEVPLEKKDPKTGAVTHRRYMLLQPDGENKWSEVHWHEDKDGNIVKKGTPGAKKQQVCLARGQEEALAIGYNAVGSPPDGATLVAVALTYWNLRHVAPDPVPPIRQRLKFR